ncbi:TetR/AcrR family transcriptional regulator [Streptomyces sp. MBT65]|uniref:TetR/AcrR family transcriptional regulator n=1 Tax=Streptomyces sp. MBT65 TaxID=1488395 RepID=UPI00190C8A7D|nr:TetR/AcrR family transcriptional regulator [Streptomyces sp. MBT65]MBK3574959.1 TetR/AcrR family transcriptional regulator [Streptomyces sp. MBT65]
MPTKRAYASPLREKAAAQTREVILRAATELFGQRGYALVTVADIAAAAGVSPKTVFASVGSKREIMDRIIDAAVIAGRCDEAMKQLRQLCTPREVLAALAAGTRFGSESQFTVHEAIRLALPVHEDGMALWERATGGSRAAMSDAAHHLHALTPRPRYTAAETGDLLWLWFGPHGWRTLVVDAGWSWDSAETAIRETAIAALYGEC